MEKQVIGLIMGSSSDWKTMRHVAETLDSLGIRYEKRVVSAHRTPDELFKYAAEAEQRGITLIIAGAGGAAHLPGMTAAKTILPVIGVPVNVTPFNGLDALLSIMQMPAEVGVATVNVGEIGAVHAALFAATILARADDRLRAELRGKRTDMLPDARAPLEKPAHTALPQVMILAEDESDLEILRHAEEQLSMLSIPYSTQILDKGAPLEELAHFARVAEVEGATAFIAGSGQGIGLACQLAKTTMLPVLAVPIVSGPIECVDKFLQPFLEMPSGMATFALGRAGAINAALFAATILSAPHSTIRTQLREKRQEQIQRVLAMKI